jgi:hypothetical protein
MDSWNTSLTSTAPFVGREGLQMRIPHPAVEVLMKTIAHATRVIAMSALMMLVSSLPAHAALSLASLGYSQDFDTLAATGTTNAWTNDSTIAGWYWQTDYTNTTYRADDGTNGTDDGRRSYGTGSAADRALGHFADDSGSEAA